MAALQTLRNKPALLMSIIGGALLLFIISMVAENGLFSGSNVEGKVNGEKITYEDYNAEVQQESNYLSLVYQALQMSGTDVDDDVKEAQKAALPELVWERFEQNQLINTQADKLGLVVTTEDVQAELNNAGSVVAQNFQQIVQQNNFLNLSSAQRIMFLMATYGVQPTVDAYKQFIKTVDQQIAQAQKQNASEYVELFSNLKSTCLYYEGKIEAELRTQKYMQLTAQCIITNPVSAKMTFDEQTTTVTADIAQVPYTTVADKDVKITDDDLKAKYEEVKNLFRIYTESRDIKYILVDVQPSTSDQNEVVASVKALEDTLRGATTAKAVEEIMRGAKTETQYANVYLTKDAINQRYKNKVNDITAALDSTGVGTVAATKVGAADQQGRQYVSTYKLVGTKVSPDSMQVCMFAVDKKAMADSIVAAVKAGATLSDIAKKHNDLVQKYGLKGDTVWNKLAYYADPEANASDSSATGYTDVCQIPAGTTAYYTISQGDQSIYVITSVLQAKAPSTKYNLAIVKQPIKFSSATYNSKRQALNNFLAKNRTVADIEKNASKAGYTVTNRPNFTTTDAMNMRYNLGNEQARAPFLWLFDDAKAGDVSQLYECGKNNDKLLVLAVTSVNDDDYLAWDNANVKEVLNQLVMNDKKAEKILASTKNVKNFAAAKAVKGAQTNEGITLGLAQLEPTLAGAIERTAAGKFTGAVKGANSIYMVQVKSKEASTAMPYNEKFVTMQVAQMTQQSIFSNVLQALVKKADISDKRYKF